MCCWGGFREGEGRSRREDQRERGEERRRREVEDQKTERRGNRYSAEATGLGIYILVSVSVCGFVGDCGWLFGVF